MLEIVHKVAREIDKLGGRTFLVGGYVRDKIMGIESKDIDVEVFGIKPERLEYVLSNFGEVDMVGSSFGVYMIKGLDVDFSMPRKERKIGDKHTDFEIEVDPFMSTEKAARRRDFTMNSIMEDVLTGEIIDHFDGQMCIRWKQIMIIDHHTFIEDELRAFRACQLAARLNFRICPTVIHTCKDFTFESLPKERIFEEIKKGLLKSDKPSIMLEYMKSMGIIEKLFPELHVLIDCEQDLRWHSEGSVWTHTMMVIDELAKIRHESKDPLALMYAGLLHDTGKPSTREIQDSSEITFHGHERDSGQLAHKFMSEITNDAKLISKVTQLVENHMRPNQIALTGSDKAVRKLMRYTDIHEQLLLSQADHLGRKSTVEGELSYDKHREWFDAKIEKLQTNDKGEIESLVMGKDLIELGLNPGPQFKEILAYAMEMQLEGLSKYDIMFLIDMHYIIKK